MKHPRRLVAGLLLAGIALLTASCGGIVNPQGWASPALDGPNAYYLQSKDHLAAITFAGDAGATTTWTFPDKNKQNQKDLKLEAIYGKPVVDGDTVYGASYSGYVFAINKGDGNLRWVRKDLQGGVIGGPVLAGDYLAFGTVDKHLYLIKKSDGTPAPGWPKDGISFGDAIWATPVVRADTLYVATMGGDVFAISLANGQKTWPKPFHSSGAIAELAGLDDTHLFVPSLNKQVYIVNTADGTAPNGGFQASDWVWTRPAFKDGIVYFGDFAGSVYALDITTGKGLWTYSGGDKVKAGPAIVEDTVVVADRKPIVHFIDARTGAGKNRVPILDSGTVRADVTALPDGSAAIVSTTKGKLFKVDPRNTTVTQVNVGSGQ